MSTPAVPLEEAIRKAKEIAVEHVERSTASHTAGAHDALIEGILAAVVQLLPVLLALHRDKQEHQPRERQVETDRPPTRHQGT